MSSLVKTVGPCRYRRFVRWLKTTKGFLASNKVNKEYDNTSHAIEIDIPPLPSPHTIQFGSNAALYLESLPTKEILAHGQQPDNNDCNDRLLDYSAVLSQLGPT